MSFVQNSNGWHKVLAGISNQRRSVLGHRVRLAHGWLIVGTWSLGTSELKLLRAFD